MKVLCWYYWRNNEQETKMVESSSFRTLEADLRNALRLDNDRAFNKLLPDRLDESLLRVSLVKYMPETGEARYGV